MSQLIERDFKKGSDILTVFNTINAAKDFFNEIKNKAEAERYKICYLTSQLPPIERLKRIEQEIKKNKNKKLVIATQLIEAGVDISLDKIYRDLSPLDSIVQTAGRTNRNCEINNGEVNLIHLKNDRDRSYATMVYDKELIKFTIEIFKKFKTLSEEELRLHLNEYYNKIIQRLDQSIDLQENIKKMEHFDVNDKFNLIERKGVQYSFFIGLDNKAKNIWNKFKDIYCNGSELCGKNKWEIITAKKKRFNEIKKDFKQYIVNISIFTINNNIEAILSNQLNLEKVNGIYFVNSDNSELYSADTGLKIKDKVGSEETFII